MEPLAFRTNISQRLLSLDFMRGFIMVLLALESTGLYEHLSDASSQGSVFHSFIQQFFHHPWNGLRFWDLTKKRMVYMEQVFQENFKALRVVIFLGCFGLCSKAAWFIFWIVGCTYAIIFYNTGRLFDFWMEFNSTNYILRFSFIAYRSFIPFYKYSKLWSAVYRPA